MRSSYSMLRREYRAAISLRSGARGRSRDVFLGLEASLDEEGLPMVDRHVSLERR